MLPLNTELRLGVMSFLIILAKNLSISIFLFFVTSILFLSRTLAVTSITQRMRLNPSVFKVTESAVAHNFLYIVAILAVISALSFVVGLLVSWLIYKNYTFTFKEFDLSMRKGILSLKETSLPYRQIQYVDIERSLNYRFLGLSRIVITTAGHEESNGMSASRVVLEPIARELAENIQQKLQREIGVQVIESVESADKESDNQK